jgi:putative zinc finger/helix-turn-helix YgiT family protein
MVLLVVAWCYQPSLISCSCRSAKSGDVVVIAFKAELKAQHEAVVFSRSDWGTFVATIICAGCNSEKVKKVREEFFATYNHGPITIPDAEMYECASCRKRFFTPDQIKAVSLAVKRQARVEAGLLTPQEIVAIRHKLGLSQSELERLFGLGAKVVTRWETGRVVHSKAADVALRLLALDPENLKRLRLRRDEVSRADSDVLLG